VLCALVGCYLLRCFVFLYGWVSLSLGAAVSLPARWCLVFDYGSWFASNYPDRLPPIRPGYSLSLALRVSLLVCIEVGLQCPLYQR